MPYPPPVKSADVASSATSSAVPEPDGGAATLVRPEPGLARGVVTAPSWVVAVLAGVLVFAALAALLMSLSSRRVGAGGRR